MNTNEPVKHWKAKLRLEMEDPDGNVRIYIIPHLEFGPGIYYADDGVIRETEATIGQYSEINYSNDPLSILKTLKPGRNFYELNLFALMREAEINGYESDMFELDPSKMDDEQKKLWEVEDK